MLEEAKKYTCRKQFKKQSSYCYKLASRIGMLDAFLSHMPRIINRKGYWTRELILEESKRYSYRVDFWKLSKPAYSAAQKLNILNDVCSHMGPKKPGKTYWNKEKIFECAKKYDKKLDFQKENTGAYSAARKLNIIDDVCLHMEFKNDQLSADANGRVCKKCNIFKHRDLICKSKKSRSGMGNKCKACLAIYCKDRLKNNPGVFNHNTANRRAMHNKATPKWISAAHKREILKTYKEAKHISKTLNIIHEVDHIIPIRSKIVCGLHVPWNLQIITREQNRAKSNRIVCHV